MIQNQQDFDFILNDPPAPPYAPIIRPEFFTRENVLKLRDSGFVSGIVLINDVQGLKNFSTESKCPNQFYRYSLQPICDVEKPETTWNPWGNGLLQENFDIPIIYLETKDEYEKVINCSQTFNKELKGQAGRSLCSIEINSFMAAAANSEVCLRRSKFSGLIRSSHFCDALQGKNVFGTLFPREIVNPTNRTNDEKEEIILVTARLDTTSMFDGVYPGAMDMASIATLTSTAHFLRKIVTNKVFEENKLNVLFMLFNGESYDYIGSQRFVYDLKKNNSFPSLSTNTRPLTLDNIILMIDIGAIDTFNELSIYHRDSERASSYAIKLQESIGFYNNDLKLSLTVTSEQTNNIPPVSAQMFLRENASFPALVLAAKRAENRFYHSVFDDTNNLNFTYQNSSVDFDQLDLYDNSSFSKDSVQIKIRNIATALGLGIYDLILKKPKSYEKKIIASGGLVDELLYCYLISTKCKLFQAAVEHHEDHRTNVPPTQRYVSVNSGFSYDTYRWTYHVFGFVLSEKIEREKSNCSPLPYFWLPGSSKAGECRYTTQNFSLALSPAFEESENYNFKSNLYSTWTESTWNDLSARIFLRPSPSHEYFTLTIGIIVFILSFIIVYVVNSKAEALFGDAVIAEQ